ncbi:hypothetical protein POM88_025341 [Heracleum sosnowskyi]|uniref:DUF659 domain-containing protein n=1 Tax=Heracleum sosnowskyi TaxID=360622 RepID=A0AAD8I5Y8_9APIA|nr:hypothetical protein POM88_025341 [Heracleum sosnowskyi]
MKLPSYHEVRVSLLKSEVESIESIRKSHEAEWMKSGCSIMIDGWQDRKHQSLINFLVNTHRGSIFIESVDAFVVSKTSDMVFELLCKYVEMIGPQNFVQVVTNSAANNKATCQLLIIRQQERVNQTNKDQIYHCLPHSIKDS